MLASMAFLGPRFLFSLPGVKCSSRARRHASFAACNTPRDVSQTDNSRAGCAARALGFCARAWQISEDSIATSAQQRELNLRVAEAPEALVTSGVASRQAVRHQSASKGRSAAAAFWHRKAPPLLIRWRSGPPTLVADAVDTTARAASVRRGSRSNSVPPAGPRRPPCRSASKPTAASRRRSRPPWPRS